MSNLGKRASIGDSMIMIYRLLLVTIIAIIITALTAVYYDYYINVKSVEGSIMAEKIVNCLAKDGTLNLDNFPEQDKNNLFNHCRIKNAERFYIEAEFFSQGDSIARFKAGDEGIQWIKDLFTRVAFGQTLEDKRQSIEKIRKYEPGLFVEIYPVYLIKNKETLKGEMSIAVLVKNE